MAEIRAYLDTTWRDRVEVKPYGFDARIGWDTHLVTINGVAAGFMNGPVQIGSEEP